MAAKRNNKAKYFDPFLLRAIEHWLDSSNELTYQPVFCEWLLYKKYVVKYEIRNTNFEQGKDVVALDPNKFPIAFQLKGGNISLNRWRSEVKPEIEALIETPINHPDIDKSKGHISYLVTNGEIDDTVRVEIVSLNEIKWKSTPLHVWTRGDLLIGFLSMAEGHFPKDSMMYQRVSNLMFADGRGSPDIIAINIFLKEILNISSDDRGKTQRRRDITSAILYSNIISGPFRKMANYNSVIRILTLLTSLIFYLVEKYNLTDQYWLSSFRILWADIKYNSKQLEQEINNDEFEKSYSSPYDNELMPFRKHLTISTIYALKLSQYLSNDEDWKSIFTPNNIKKYQNSIAIFGEASFLPPLYVAFIFKNYGDRFNTALSLIQNAIISILTNNGRNTKNKTGLISPYYDLEFFLKVKYNDLEDPFEETFKLSSYLLKPLIEILTRLEQREFISLIWQDASYFHFNQYLPEATIDYYLLYARDGENRTEIPRKIKSWQELKKEANNYSFDSIPKLVKRFPFILPFLLNLLPYRANSATIAFLDFETQKIKL